MRVTASAYEQQRLQQLWDWKTQPFKHWADGRAHYIKDILDRTLIFWHLYHRLWPGAKFRKGRLELATVPSLLY